MQHLAAQPTDCKTICKRLAFVTLNRLRLFSMFAKLHACAGEQCNPLPAPGQEPKPIGGKNDKRTRCEPRAAAYRMATRPNILRPRTSAQHSAAPFNICAAVAQHFRSLRPWQRHILKPSLAKCSRRQARNITKTVKTWATRCASAMVAMRWFRPVKNTARIANNGNILCYRNSNA